MSVISRYFPFLQQLISEVMTSAKFFAARFGELFLVQSMETNTAREKVYFLCNKSYLFYNVGTSGQCLSFYFNACKISITSADAEFFLFDNICCLNYTIL